MYTRLLLGVLGVALSGSALSAADKKEAYGFQFHYANKLEPKEYLQQHPVIAGTWRFKQETDTHWIGELHYPTGNVSPAFPKDDEPAFMVTPIQIAKEKAPPVNLKTYEGSVLLLQADATVRFASKKSLESSFKLIAVETAKGTAEPFLFKKRAELAFTKEK